MIVDKSKGLLEDAILNIIESKIEEQGIDASESGGEFQIHLFLFY